MSGDVILSTQVSLMQIVLPEKKRSLLTKHHVAVNARASRFTKEQRLHQSAARFPIISQLTGAQRFRFVLPLSTIRGDVSVRH